MAPGTRLIELRGGNGFLSIGGFKRVDQMVPGLNVLLSAPRDVDKTMGVQMKPIVDVAVFHFVLCALFVGVWCDRTPSLFAVVAA